MRKVKVPENISEECRRFGLPRAVSIDFWNYIHTDVPANYGILSKGNREDRGFRHRKVIDGNGGEKFLFTIYLDDTTSPDDLIITELHCVRRFFI